MKIHNKKGLEFSFTWLFAVIIGATILILAIYAATKLIGTSETQTSTATAKEIGVLLNPLETSFEDSTSTSFSINTETRIYNICDNSSNFGSQGIQTAQKSFGKWSGAGIKVSFQNKYIFSNGIEEGKKFYVFSKPFDFPFKTADLIYLSSAKKIYCFTGMPDEIEEELTELKQGNFFVGNCSSLDAVKVCPEVGCDIRVRYGQGYVEKNGTKLYFETDALMYGAIFSDKRTYECQVQRLMQRAETLSRIYERKAGLLEQKGCSSNIDLGTYEALLGNYENSLGLGSLLIKSNELKQGNDRSPCGLW